MAIKHRDTEEAISIIQRKITARGKVISFLALLLLALVVFILLLYFIPFKF